MKELIYKVHFSRISGKIFEETTDKKFVDRHGECLTIEDSRSDHTVFEGTEEECENYIEGM